MAKTTFYHAGCPVCASAKHDLNTILGRSKFDVEIVHLGEQPAALPAAKQAGVQSVPALVMENGSVLHINFGVDINALG